MIEKYYIDFKTRDYMENEKIETKIKNSCLDCSLGVNPFIDENKMYKYIKEGTCQINEYPIYGYDRLKKELLNFWKNQLHNDSLNEDNITFGSGVMGTLRNISEFLIKKGTYVLGCSPQFPRIISEVELKRGIYEYYSLSEKNNYRFDVDEFVDNIKERYNVIIIDNPNNPTGQIIDLKDIELIIKKAKVYNITVIIDEAYGEYMNLDNSAIQLINKYNNLVVLHGASKFWGLPNHRIGYLFASKDFVKVYNEISIPFAFSDLSANIFADIVKDYEYFKETKAKVIEEKKKILDELNSDNYLYTNIETPIFTIKSSKYKNLSEELMKNNIIAESCGNFINLDSSYARIRIPNKSENFVEVLKEILK